MATTRRKEVSGSKDDKHLFISTSSTVITTLCGPDACMRGPQMSPSLATLPGWNTQAPAEPEDLEHFFEANYLQALKDSFKFGYVYGFVNATPTTAFKKIYRQMNLTPQQQAFANQCIKSFAILGVAQLLGMLDTNTALYIIGAPLISDGLTHLGVNDHIAHALPAITGAFVHIASDIRQMDKTLLTMAAGVAGTLFGKLTVTTLRNRFFHSVDNELTGLVEKGAPRNDCESGGEMRLATQ